MKPELEITLRAMLAELESNALVVEIAPAPDARHLMHGVRVVVSKNAPWYRDFCARYPSQRRDQNRHGRTAIKRADTIRAFQALLADSPSLCPIYGPRLLEAARRYWRRHASDLREQLAEAQLAAA